MTYDDFIHLVKNPGDVPANWVNELKDIVDKYPYFTVARWLYVKSLSQSDNIQLGSALKPASVYLSDRRWLYFYLYPERKNRDEVPFRRDEKSQFSGSYFDMMETVEKQGTDTKQSLKELADKLKSARMTLAAEKSKPAPETRPAAGIETAGTGLPVIEIISRPYFDQPEELPKVEFIPGVGKKLEYTEENAKKLIRERQYEDALLILRYLNLNNPKKNIYFADQIRFLEKIVSNKYKEI